MENPLLVFISSVIQGMEAERKAAEAAIQAIPLSRPWVFEHSPASSLPLQESYLSKVRQCDIFVLLLGDRLTDPVKLEVTTAQAANKPLLVFRAENALQGVVAYARSLGVKYAEYRDPKDLAAKVAEAVGDELITGYRRHGVARADLGTIGEFLDRLAQGQAKVEVGGDQIIATGPVATRGSAVSIGGGTAVAGSLHVDYGDTYELPPGPQPDPTALRQAYLSHVLEQTKTLQLAGVDPKAAREPAAQTGLVLVAVYTALVTQQTKQGEPRGMPTPEREARGLSAVAVLDREPKLVLLGDPGSGKSTFVNFVALCLAGEGLGRPDANLALMKAPLPREAQGSSSRDESPPPQPWCHGALLPVHVVLRDFAARGLPPAGQQATGDRLWRFIVAELGETLADYAPYLKRELREAGGLVLLDGLDEVPEADARRIQVKRAVLGFAADFPRCRFAVTSRTYAYQRQDWKLPDFAEAVLAPFTREQIDRFVDRWYTHLAAVRGQNREDAQGRAILLKEAIRHSDRLRALAERPLLLTLMASLHAWRGGNLPEKREELYADTVDLLLDQWESPKMVRGPDGKPAVAEPSLLEWLKLDRAAVSKLLERLAFEAHRDQPPQRGQPALTGTADIGQERLVTGLVNLTANPDVKPARVIEYVRDRAGLLAARGVGVYTFPHRTFQEYLAACYLTDHGYPDDLADLVLADGQRWREVALLAGAKAARGTLSAVWDLAEALCCRNVGAQPEGAECLAALLAAQTLIENGALASVSARNRPKAECIRLWLRAIAERGVLLPLDRAAAGDALTVMGDDRPGVGLRPDGLPDIAWCEVPVGEFIMGEGSHQYRNSIPNPYQISKYPITNAQFTAFARDAGYQQGKYWQHAEQAGFWHDGKVRTCQWAEHAWQESWFDGPAHTGFVPHLSSHPAEEVNWYEAVAFCLWLGDKLRLQVSLPTEAQWERAARSTDGRTYPWGEQITPDHANYAETGIGATTAVGIFPKGANPETGVLDMSGNVWEWCQTKWGENHDKPEDNDPPGRRYACVAWWHLPR